MQCYYTANQVGFLSLMKDKRRIRFERHLPRGGHARAKAQGRIGAGMQEGRSFHCKKGNVHGIISSIKKEWKGECRMLRKKLRNIIRQYNFLTAISSSFFLWNSLHPSMLQWQI